MIKTWILTLILVVMSVLPFLLAKIGLEGGWFVLVRITLYLIGLCVVAMFEMKEPYSSRRLVALFFLTLLPSFLAAKIAIEVAFGVALPLDSRVDFVFFVLLGALSSFCIWLLLLAYKMPTRGLCLKVYGWVVGISCSIVSLALMLIPPMPVVI